MFRVVNVVACIVFMGLALFATPRALGAQRPTDFARSWEITVTQVDTYEEIGSVGDAVTPNGVFLAFRFEVTNLTGEPAFFPHDALTLRGDAGSVFEADANATAAFIVVETDIIDFRPDTSETLAAWEPGVAYDEGAVFDVPREVLAGGVTLASSDGTWRLPIPSGAIDAGWLPAALDDQRPIIGSATGPQATATTPTPAAAIQTAPSLDSEQTEYLRSVIAHLGELTDSGQRVLPMLDAIARGQDVDLSALKSELANWRPALASGQAIQPPAGLGGVHDDYLSALALWAAAAREIDLAAATGNDDLLLASLDTLTEAVHATGGVYSSASALLPGSQSTAAADQCAALPAWISVTLDTVTGVSDTLEELDAAGLLSNVSPSDAPTFLRHSRRLEQLADAQRLATPPDDLREAHDLAIQAVDDIAAGLATIGAGLDLVDSALVTRGSDAFNAGLTAFSDALDPLQPFAASCGYDVDDE